MAENRFYTEFDFERLVPRQGKDYRNPFQVDRDRIIHSSAFRRLQAKTQVFLSGEYDFYRTRLTHSLEVAQIGRSICDFLQKNDPHLGAEFFIDSHLVEAVCLAHDLGHPPFGHAGESTLNRLMRPYGGFEGNAQTLRVLTEIIYPDGSARKGMNPTRALVDGVLKYKALLGELADPENHFIYDYQHRYRDFVFSGREIPAALTDPETLNRFRSIECQIMDWADDTAYSLDDVVDGIHAGFINEVRLAKWGERHNFQGREAELLEALLRELRSGNVERAFARKIGEFIQAVRLEEQDNFLSDLTNRYRFRLEIDLEIRQEANFYKKLAVELVFRTPELHQIEYKGNFVLERLFRAYRENYLAQGQKKLSLLPESLGQALAEEPDETRKMRLVCDHLAGMTDGFALRTYKRLFDPDFGSIMDLV